MRVAAVAAGIAFTLLAGATSALAQSENGHQIQIGGGTAIPVARFDTNYTSGPAALIAISTGGTQIPIGLRLDYSYNAFHGKTVNGKTYRDAHMNVVTGDLVFAPHTGPYIKPYALAGMGWYPYREATDTKRSNDWGANFGLGLTFPLPLIPTGAFVEARYHRVFGANKVARRFIPIIAGVTF